MVEGYCTVRVKWNAGEPDDEQVAHPGMFEEVVVLLKQVSDRHADEPLPGIRAVWWVEPNCAEPLLSQSIRRGR